MQKTVFPFLAFAILLFFTACSMLGGSVTAKLDPRTTSPCQFLTKQEAAEILGVSVDQLRIEELPRPSDLAYVSCGIAAPKGNDLAAIGIIFYGLGETAGGEVFQQAQDRLVKANRFYPIEGLGDEAFNLNAASPIVRKGDFVFSTTFSVGLVQSDIEKAKLVAVKVLEKMK